MARAIDSEVAYQFLAEQLVKETGAFSKGVNKGLNIARSAIRNPDVIPTLTQPPITGDTSDGYHTFNELYHHRAILFSVICNERPEVAWKSKRHHDGTMYDGMFIVGIDTPEGQATYHYDIDPYWNLFRVKELELAPEWDGHTPGEAIRRIGTLTQPNEPLTLEQLREMDGEPVWAERENAWGIVEIQEGKPFIFGTNFECGYSPHWNIYRRPPEGEEDT